MQKIDSLNQVAAFHKTFKAPVLDTPQIPSPERCKLRVSLIAEELKELQEAIENNDLVEVADALCDIQYVLSGAVLEFGLGEKFVELFDEVQRSNMSKACSTYEEAEATVKHYFDKDGTMAEIVQDGEKFLVYRIADNKVLKSVKYSPADLKGVLEKK
jgi:predicted HAD superfamily Cof-like phosphohydrolase